MGPEPIFGYKPGTVYALCESTGKPRYVGVTTVALRKRRMQHMSTARRGGRTRRDAWIRELLRSGSGPALWCLEEDIPASDICERERAWIAACRLWGCDLLNEQDGGVGFNDRSGAVAAKISATLKSAGIRPPPRTGIKHTPETRAKMSAAHRHRRLESRNDV